MLHCTLAAVKCTATELVAETEYRWTNKSLQRFVFQAFLYFVTCYILHLYGYLLWGIIPEIHEKTI